MKSYFACLLFPLVLGAFSRPTIDKNPYDSLNDAKLKAYCNDKRELSDACVAYAQFEQLFKIDRTLLEGEKALKAQRKEAKKLAEIIHNIVKEMFEDEAAHLLQQNEK